MRGILQPDIHNPIESGVSMSYPRCRTDDATLKRNFCEIFVSSMFL